MILKILLILVFVVIALAIFVATRPADFRITRSATLAAPSHEVFAQINNFHNWEAWSPWARLDPNAVYVYEGPTEGEGAKLSWSGNSEVGQGSNTLIESIPNKLIRIRLDFLKPFKATHTAEFSLEPEGGETRVTWSMYGRNNFAGKAVSLLMNCDKMVGGQFEQGLANLKEVVEPRSLPVSLPDA